MEYKIVAQNKIAVLTIEGNVKHEDKTKLSECTKEILQKEMQAVIIYFKNTSHVDIVMLRELTLLQHEIRKQNMKLKITGLSVQLKNTLSEKGVIRNSEIAYDFNHALSSLVENHAV